MVLPCVCKRWARILGQPCAAWEHITVELSDLHSRSKYRGQDEHLFLDARVIAAWFSR